MTGRPPTTTEGEVRRLVRRLRGPAGAMATHDRLQAIDALMRQIVQGTNYGRPGREHLLRLAAHAQAWAEELEDA